MVNVNRYSINFTKFVTQRIPEALRFDELIAFVNQLVQPVVTLYGQLLAFRALCLYRLTITPQVCYLEKMLNDQYDNVLRRIYIADGLNFDPTFIYTEPELQPVFLRRESEAAPAFVFTEGEVGQFTFDFVVFVPADVAFDSTEMTSRVRSYKLAGKLFKIQTF